MIYNRYDVVKVPFPFTDKNNDKIRPAVVISKQEYAIDTSHYVLIMITSSQQISWPGDIAIENLSTTGLPIPSKIRFKIFSLDERLIIGKLGSLDQYDQLKLDKLIKYYF